MRVDFAGLVGCLYGLFIHFVYRGWVLMAKVYYGFRFNAEQYAAFKRVAILGGSTVTGAFERFMSGCIEAGVLVFPDMRISDLEGEAKVLVDWLGKGKHFFRAENGEEVNIQGRLIWLLPKVQDSTLKSEMEDILKKSVSMKE